MGPGLLVGVGGWLWGGSSGQVLVAGWVTCDKPPPRFILSLVSIQGMAGGYAQIFEMDWGPGSPVLVGSVLAICMSFSYAY